ncbi:hypothetical protein B0H19DRAFT_431625 [Mycena capillaripes]|nr:hypothetical protein B0H19DRAFT_431625 [Mycena capillaripes]
MNHLPSSLPPSTLSGLDSIPSCEAMSRKVVVNQTAHNPVPQLQDPQCWSFFVCPTPARSPFQLRYSPYSRSTPRFGNRRRPIRALIPSLEFSLRYNVSTPPNNVFWNGYNGCSARVSAENVRKSSYIPSTIRPLLFSFISIHSISTYPPTTHRRVRASVPPRTPCRPRRFYPMAILPSTHVKRTCTRRPFAVHHRAMPRQSLATPTLFSRPLALHIFLGGGIVKAKRCGQHPILPLFQSFFCDVFSPSYAPFFPARTAPEILARYMKILAALLPVTIHRAR